MHSEQSTSIKAGLFVIFCGTLLIIAIVLLGQRKRFKRQYRLWTEFHNAYGLANGADVRLAGVEVGNVCSVCIVTNTNGKSTVKVELDIDTAHRNKIAIDSRASIRSTGPLGDKYIEITLGSDDRLQAGDRIPSDEAEDLYEIAKKARIALERANNIAEQINTAFDAFIKTKTIEDLAASVESGLRTAVAVERGPGLLHNLIYSKTFGEEIAADVSAAVKAWRGSAESVQAGKGPLGQMLHSEALEKAIADLVQASASAKNILREIERGEGTAHALIYDSKELETIREFGTAVRRFNAILAQVEEGTGTLGLLINDPELWEIVKRVLGGVEESRTLKFLIRRQVSE